MRLRDRINLDLTAAIKARDSDRLRVLRMMKAAVKNKEIDERKELDDGHVVQLLVSQIKQRDEAIEQFTRGRREDLAAREREEIRVIESYLPPAVADEELAAVVEEAVAATGASSARDIGAVMKECMARLAGRRADGKRVNELVRRRLSPSG